MGGAKSFFALSSLIAVVHGDRTVDIQWYGYSLCQFCFESANVVGNALAIDGLNELVRIPVPHKYFSLFESFEYLIYIYQAFVNIDCLYYAHRYIYIENSFFLVK